jgi:hypothetical protein
LRLSRQIDFYWWVVVSSESNSQGFLNNYHSYKSEEKKIYIKQPDDLLKWDVWVNIWIKFSYYLGIKKTKMRETNETCTFLFKNI